MVNLNEDRRYFITKVFKNKTEDTGHCIKFYAKAFRQATDYLIEDKKILSVLIYSNHGTATVVRKHQIKSNDKLTTMHTS